jgi:nucleotide-binding universal stress UspA family protein
MYTTLLVPIDGSDFSAGALPLAAAIARRTNAVVHLALVNDPSAYIPFVPGEVAVPVYDADLVRQRRAADQATLDKQIDELKTVGVRVIGALLEGTVVESLIEYGQQVAAQLTVLTTHGRGGFERLRLGSVATAYLARATTPVLLVHGAGIDGEHTKPLSALPTGVVLCPLDGSEFAARALPHAANFAEACGLPMELFSVTTPRTVSMAPFATEALLADPSLLEQEEHDRIDYLTKIAATMPAGTTTHEVVDMSVGRAILEEASRGGAGAIAVATHGRGGLARLVLGSVADEVIRHSTLPVLVYRPEPPK